MRVIGATCLSYSELPTMHVGTLQETARVHNLTLDVIANVYDRAGVIVPHALRTVHLKSFKGLFWRKHITPAVVQSYDFVWLFDSDLDIANFALWNVLGAMMRNDALAAQPRIRRHSRLSTDHPHLRAHPRCQRCDAQCTDFIEVMTPVFTRVAWAHVFTGLLGSVSHARLRVGIAGVDTQWCAYLKNTVQSSAQTAKTNACLVTNVTIVHYDRRTLRREGMQRSNKFKVYANRGMRDDYHCPFCLREGIRSCQSFEIPNYAARTPRLKKIGNTPRAFFSRPFLKHLL